jgi:hypothetical protein
MEEFVAEFYVRRVEWQGLRLNVQPRFELLSECAVGQPFLNDS